MRRNPHTRPYRARRVTDQVTHRRIVVTTGRATSPRRTLGADTCPAPRRGRHRRNRPRPAGAGPRGRRDAPTRSAAGWEPPRESRRGGRRGCARCQRPASGSGWQTTSTFTAVNYGAPDFLTTAQSAGLGGGTNFFAAGPAGLTTASQSIDVSAQAAAIDAGRVGRRSAACWGLCESGGLGHRRRRLPERLGSGARAVDDRTGDRGRAQQPDVASVTHHHDARADGDARHPGGADGEAGGGQLQRRVPRQHRPRARPAAGSGGGGFGECGAGGRGGVGAAAGVDPVCQPDKPSQRARWVGVRRPPRTGAAGERGRWPPDADRDVLPGPGGGAAGAGPLAGDDA